MQVSAGKLSLPCLTRSPCLLAVEFSGERLLSWQRVLNGSVDNGSVERAINRKLLVRRLISGRQETSKMPRTAHSKTLWLLAFGALFAPLAIAQEGRVRLTDRPQPLVVEADELTPENVPPLMRDVSLQQEQTTVPVPPPAMNARPSAAPRKGTSTELSRDASQSGSRTNRIDESRRGTQPNGLTYRVPPSDAQSRAATDAGNHLGKSPAAPPVWIQQRNPIVSDSRISGSRVGRIAGNGSVLGAGPSGPRLDAE